jgi:hypothetical protein
MGMCTGRGSRRGVYPKGKAAGGPDLQPGVGREAMCPALDRGIRVTVRAGRAEAIREAGKAGPRSRLPKAENPACDESFALFGKGKQMDPTNRRTSLNERYMNRN